MSANNPDVFRYTMFPAERAVLLDLVQRSPGRVIVEIGAHVGLTTVELAAVCRQTQRRLVVVDPWDGTQDGAGDHLYQEFAERTKGFADVMQVQRCRSVNAVYPPNVGVVFVDGDHRDPWPDFVAGWNALVDGGYLVIHDVDDPGWPKIAEVVSEFPAPHRFRYQYRPTAQEFAVYGKGVRGLVWFVKC